MTSKLDPQELERLSKAATQGELWLYGELDVGLDYEPFFGAPLEGNMHPLQPMTREDQAFVMALWNAYRTGQLVPAMPSGDVVEAVAREALLTALHDAINAPKGVVPASAEAFYDAARAALGEKP